MKKTGKALSLVLSLALVVSSLTATFASAATAKTEYLPSATEPTAIDMVNGKSGSASLTDLSTKIPAVQPAAETSDHLKVQNLTLAEVVHKSGAALLSTKIDSDTHKLSATLVSDNNVGSEVLAARYVSDPSLTYRYTDSTQPIVFTYEVDYTVIVHKANSVAFALDSSIPKNSATKQITGKLLQYTADSGMLAKTTELKIDTVADNVKKGATSATALGTYYVTVPSYAGNKSCVATTTSATEFVATLTPPTGSTYLNYGTVVFYATKVSTAATKDADAVLDTANTIVGMSSVLNSIDLGSLNYISQWKGITWADSSKAAASWNSETSSDPAPSKTALNITGCNITLGGDTEMVKGNVGNVNGTGKFTVDNGTVGTIGDITEVDIANGNVGAIDVATVKVTGGTTGAIVASSVSVDATDSNGKITTRTGAISAKTITIGSAATAASIVTGAIKEIGTEGDVLTGPAIDSQESITLTSALVTVASIDCNYYKPAIDLKGFSGTIGAPVNAGNATIMTEANGNTNTSAIVSGDVTVDSVNAGNGVLTFAKSLNVNSVAGVGTVVIPAGAMKVNKSINSVSLKLSNSSLTAGMTAFYAPAYSVYDGSLKTIGYTLDYDAVNTGTKTGLQPFNIKSVVFAGLTIAPVGDASNKIVQKTKATYKVSAYPAGQPLPDGDAINISFSGSTNNFSYTTTADTITVSADKFEPLFTSLNKGTITATLVDKATNTPIFGVDPATYDVQMIEKPEVNFTCDSFPTTMKAGQQYTVKITSNDGTKPVIKFADGWAVITKTTTSGNSTFVTFTAKTASEHGVYVSGNKAAVIKVAGSICDTTTVSKKAGKPYTFKVTSPKAPTFVVAGIGSIKPSKVSGHDYYYMVKATANKGVHGVYINGAVIALYTFA